MWHTPARRTWRTHSRRETEAPILGGHLALTLNWGPPGEATIAATNGQAVRGEE